MATFPCKELVTPYKIKGKASILGFPIDDCLSMTSSHMENKKEAQMGFLATSFLYKLVMTRSTGDYQPQTTEHNAVQNTPV
jgi:hypothetical protein